LAHEGTDILELSTPGTMLRRLPSQPHGFRQFFRHRNGGQLIHRNGQKLLPEALQGAVFFFLLGSAFGVFLFHIERSPDPADACRGPIILNRR
jgi:hypothetical protein